MNARKKDARKPLFLHIGLHKTGTTYLQSFLAENVSVLSRHGTCFPTTGRKGPQHLTFASFDSETVQLEDLFRSLIEESRDHRQVVLSAERFSKLFLDRERLHEFTAAAGNHFRPRIVVYLRRQDELKESIFTQVVKDWYHGTIADENAYLYDHLERIRRLWAELPRSDVIVRAYDSRLWVDKRLDHDFLSALGITRHADFEEVEPVNIGLNRRETLFLANVVKARLTDKAGFVEHLTSQALIADDGVRYVSSPDDRREFLSQFLESNRQLGREADLPDGGQFLLEMPDDDESWMPAAPLSEAEAAAVATSIWNSLADAETAP